mgnify:CR=1 FL=1
MTIYKVLEVIFFNVSLPRTNVRGFFMLKVNNISFEYNEQKEILKGISFELEVGEHLCVMGESGSGKSTLMKAIVQQFFGLMNNMKTDLLKTVSN